MKNLYLLLFGIILLLAPGFVLGQSGVCFGGGCTMTGSSWGSAQSTTSATFVSSVAGTYAGEYNTYNVTSGAQYEWSLCLADGATCPTADAQLTLKNTSNTILCYADDICGAYPKILWTATFTGQVRVLVNQYSCVTNSSSHTVRWRQVSGGGGGCTYTVPFSGNNTITASSGTICDHAGTSNYANGANGYTVINPVSGAVRLTFSSFALECCCDAVTVFDGVGTGGTVLFSGNCTTLPPVLTSTTGPLTIRFTSDGSVVNTGFSATISNVPLAYNPCTSITNISGPCVSTSTSVAASTGAYNPPSSSCGFSTPGQEKIFTFTPSVTGTYTIAQTTAVGYLDWFFKPSSGGCSSTGWTCIDDVFNNATSVGFTLTGGTQYYIMLDPETTTAGSISFTINPPVPSAPTSVTASPATVCPSATSQLNATSSGNTIRWWNAASGGTQLGTSGSGANFAVNPATTTTYYAESYNATCNQASATRTAVTVNVTPAPAAPTAATATPATINCPGTSVNLVGTSTGNTIRWWNAASGGTQLGTSASGANFAVAPTATTTYYAESFDACSQASSTRTPVTVTLSQPAPTAVTATPSTVCPGATVQLNATNTGGSINWYTVPTGGTAIGTSASAANFAVTPSGTTTYYAESQFSGGGGGGPTTQTFSYTGSAQSFTVPPGVTSINVDVQGAQGGQSGANGGRVVATVPVTPGQVLQINVGGQGGTVTTGVALGGFNGGGNSGSCTTNYAGGGGGGASDIRQGGTALGNRVVVAGGGGGGHSINGNPGAGGGLNGGNVVSTGNGCIATYATGGTQVAGGTPATGTASCCFGPAVPGGSLGVGGNGSGPAASCNGGDSGAGGGGGYYGGGGGFVYSAGGGGSSYTGGGVTGVTHTQGFKSGNGVVVITYTASAGCTSATRVPVTVTVPAAPTISTPSAQSLTLNASCGGTLPNYTTLPTTTGTGVVVTQSPAINSAVSGTGAMTVTLTATDGCSRTATSSFTVNKSDVTPPGFTTCPSAQTLNLNASCGGTLPNYVPLATATDACLGTVTITQSPAAGTPVSGVGTQTVTLTATDANTNTATCSFTVNKTDNTPPSFTTCPSAQTLVLDASCGGTLGNYISLAVATDACAGSVTITQSPAPGTPVSGVGPTTVVLTATDANTNTATCSFTVNKTDNTPPSFTTCPSAQTLVLDASCGGTLGNYVSLAVATDACAGSVTITQSPAPGTTVSGVGPTTVVLTATDANTNTATCSFTVNKTDNTPPSFTTCPSAQTLVLDASCGGTLGNYVSLAVATDACAGSVTITQSPAPGTTVSGVGPTAVVLTATDANTNTATCSFTVNKTDNTPPSFTTCPSAQTLVLDASCGGTLGNYVSLAVATDACAGSVTITQSPAPGTTVSGVGPTTVVLTATDANTNTATCSFTVNKTDNTPPSFTTCPSAQILVLDASCGGTLPNYVSLAVATDACAGSVTITQSPAPGTTVSGVGPTTVVLTATDANTNTATCSFTVNKTDNTPPSFTTCPSAQILVLDASCGGTLPNYVSLAVATDACAGSVTITQSPAPGTTVSGVGPTTVVLTATDANTNTATCSFTVNKTDNTPPSFTTCPSAQILVLDASCGGTLPNYVSLAVATDACAGSVTITQSPAPGTTVSGVGPTTVVLTATDANTNTATCSFTVNKTDNTPPSFTTCPSAQTLVLDASCGGTLGNYISLAVATDACAGSVTITQSPAPGTTVSGVGPTAVVLTATDANTNTATCSFTVNKTDNTPPSFTTCPSAQTLVLDASCGGTLPNYVSLAVATDACAGSVTITQSPAPGTTVSGVGPTTVVLTATDANTNTATCSFTVTKTDNTPPSFTTCPSAQTLVLDASCGGTLGNYISLAVAADACAGSVTITQSPAPGTTVSGVGPTTVVLTATDANTNTATCSFTVNKTDNTPPAFTTCPSAQTLVLDASCGGTLGNYISLAVATDACAGSVTITQSPAPGTTVSGVGPTTVVLTATDANTNTATCSFTVNKTDNTPPSFTTCPSAQILVLDASCGGTLPNYVSLAVATDACAGSVTITQSPAPGTTVSGVGPTTVVLTATDANTNTATCSFTVTKTDNTPPSFTTCPSAQTLVLDASCGGTLGNYISLAVAADACAGSVTITQTPAPGTPVSGVGPTTVVLTATDANTNTATCSFTVTKTDNTPPAFTTCPSAQTLVLDASCGGTLPNYVPLATATDACAGAVTITQSPAAGTPVSGVGTQTVTLTATDASTNTATCSFTVTKTDNTPPVTPSLTPVTGQCSASATPPTTTDACAGTITGTTSDPTSYSTQGSYMITWTFDDGNGNNTQATQTVVVDDTQAPTPDVASLPAVNANCGVTLTAPTATDACAGAITGTTGTMSYTTPGTYTAVWTYDDGNGNSVTQNQSVTVTGAAVTATSNSPVCTGSDLQLMSSGSGAGSYVWTGPAGTYSLQNATVAGATPTASGTWNVTWTSSAYPSCIASATVNVFVGPITLAVNPNPTVNTEATAVVSNCTSPYTVFWRTLIGATWSSASSASNSYTITGLQPATAYMAYAVDANGATTSIVYFITSGVPFCGNSPTATAIANCNKVFVDWSGGNILDINGNPYTQWVAQIQRVSPTLGPVQSSGYISTLSHVFTIPTNGFGATYQVTVSGMCNNQYSVYSPPVQVTVNDPRPLAPTVTPTSFTTNCASTTKSITVNWTPSGTGPAALGGWRVRVKQASSTGGYGIAASTVSPSINTLTFNVAANVTYKVFVEPMGCSNLVGTPSQVYLVTSCAQPNGNATLTTVRLDETQNYDDLITDEENNAVDIVLEAGISVYPNPNNGAFTVSAENILDETAKIEVMNMLGQVVYTQEVSTDNGLLSHEINLSNESSIGTYLVKITTKSGSYHTKFVKM